MSEHHEFAHFHDLHDDRGDEDEKSKDRNRKKELGSEHGSVPFL
jgi:hypothetical protein